MWHLACPRLNRRFQGQRRYLSVMTCYSSDQQLCRFYLFLPKMCLTKRGALFKHYNGKTKRQLIFWNTCRLCSSVAFLHRNKRPCFEAWNIFYFYMLGYQVFLPLFIGHGVGQLVLFFFQVAVRWHCMRKLPYLHHSSQGKRFSQGVPDNFRGCHKG